MAGLGQLRASAKALGIPAKEIRAADTADALQALITLTLSGGNSNSATAVKKKRGRPKGSTTKTTTATKRKPGRPKGSTTKTATPKRGPGRPRKASSNGNGNGGRHLIGKINWSKTGDWNPREDSVPDVIVKALRKFKGDREKTYNLLVKDLKNLVPVKTRTGVKRSIADRQEYLQYLIARNAWAFAMKSGQHEKSENRAEYGTAGTGAGTYKPKRRSGRPAGQTARKSTRSTAGAKKASQSARRGRPPAKRGPGRPKGSRNKPKTGARKSTARR